LKRTTLDAGLAAGTTPTRRDLERLAREGFRTVINLNMEGEPGLSMSPNVEASWAHACALAHVRVGVDLEFLGPEHAERFLDAFARAEPPVYVHSHDGRRAAAFAVLAYALERDLDAPTALARAAKDGLTLDSEPLRRFIADAITREAYSVSARYSPDTGAPVDVYIDYDRALQDEEIGYTISELGIFRTSGP